MSFAFARRGTRKNINAGSIIIAAFFLLLLLNYGTGLFEVGSADVESNKTRTILAFVSYTGVALYIISTIRTTRARSILVGCLVASLTFACVVGILQGFGGPDLRFLLTPPGFVQTSDAESLANRGGALRAVGTSSHAIEFSVLAAAAVPLSFHLARFGTTRICRQLSTIACLVAFLAVPTAVSRSGVLALAGSLIVYMLAINVRLLANALFFGLAGLLAYKVFSPGAVNSLWATILGSGDDLSIEGRTQDYAVVAEQFREDPWFGLGLGGYPPTERLLDNQWLQAIVQGGVVGLAAMTIFTLGGIAGMTAGLRSARSSRERDLVYALGAAFVGVIISSFTFDLFAFSQATYVVFILFALLWSTQSLLATTEMVDSISEAQIT